MTDIHRREIQFRWHTLRLEYPNWESIETAECGCCPENGDYSAAWEAIHGPFGFLTLWGGALDGDPDDVVGVFYDEQWERGEVYREEGRNDYFLGKWPVDCPYPWPSEAGSLWLDGYEECVDACDYRGDQLDLFQIEKP